MFDPAVNQVLVRTSVERSADVLNKSVSNTCVMTWTSEGTAAIMLCSANFQECVSLNLQDGRVW